MNYNDLHKKTEQLRVLVKYGISGIAIIATAHCGMLCFGLDVVYIHVAFCLFALVLGISLSRVFNLCLVHKVSVVYVVSVLTCIVMRRHGLFEKAGISLHAARCVMFAIGVIISICNIWKIKNNGNC